MIRHSVVAALLAIAANAAVAAEFASVAKAGAVLFDGPSPNASRLFVAPQGMPLELLSVIRLWVKARDASGDVFWIEKSDISPVRTVVATDLSVVRAFANDAGEVLFEVEQGVVLELLESDPAPGWARVRHRDGTTGFVRVDTLWGL